MLDAKVAFAPWPFWLKPFLFKSSLLVARRQDLKAFAPRKTDCANGPQGMESGGDAIGMVRCHSRGLAHHHTSGDFGHDQTDLATTSTWSIWADFGRARPILANGPPRAPDPRAPPLPRTALRRTAQNFALFLSFSRSHFHSCFSLWVSSRVFFPLSGGLLVEFWWCFGRSGSSNVLVFALGLSCGSPAACKIPRDPQRKKDTRRHPERGKKNENGSGRRKKNAKFWAPSPTLFLFWGPNLSGPLPFGPPLRAPNFGPPIPSLLPPRFPSSPQPRKCPKLTVAKVGETVAKAGRARCETGSVGGPRHRSSVPVGPTTTSMEFSSAGSPRSSSAARS